MLRTGTCLARPARAETSAGAPLPAQLPQVRKTWNPRAFKGQVSPHEFMQVCICSVWTAGKLGKEPRVETAGEGAAGNRLVEPGRVSSAAPSPPLTDTRPANH